MKINNKSWHARMYKRCTSDLYNPSIIKYWSTVVGMVVYYLMVLIMAMGITGLVGNGLYELYKYGGFGGILAGDGHSLLKVISITTLAVICAVLMAALTALVLSAIIVAIIFTCMIVFNIVINPVWVKIKSYTSLDKKVSFGDAESKDCQ